MSRLLGTLSNYDEDGNENITKKIMNLRPFKLHCNSLELLNLLNVTVTFRGVEF